MGCKAKEGTPTYKLQAEAKEAKMKAQAEFYLEAFHKEHISSLYERLKDINIVQSNIDKYFKTCLYHDLPLTIPGLELALDMESSEMSILLSSDIDNSWNVSLTVIKAIKKAKKVVESYTASKLHTQYSTGAIFALKNMGWIDKIDNNVNVLHFGNIVNNSIEAEVIKPKLNKPVINELIVDNKDMKTIDNTIDLTIKEETK